MNKCILQNRKAFKLNKHKCTSYIGWTCTIVAYYISYLTKLDKFVTQQMKSMLHKCKTFKQIEAAE
jgi:hypothetical protein